LLENKIRQGSAQTALMSAAPALSHAEEQEKCVMDETIMISVMDVVEA
jgi:hypothetical protein